jgi:2-amino-4-hydroxy-6-hydroxymethyldihydropteridine diphosphokinase
MSTAYIALGANLGDREATLRDAVADIALLGDIERVSSLYETEPVGFLDQPPFLNAVVSLTTNLTPLELLRELQRIEQEHGRNRTFINAPRTLDLDLLIYDDVMMETPELTLPHPRMHERAFVLVPFVEIAPDVTIPGLWKASSELLTALGPTTGISLYKTGDS